MKVFQLCTLAVLACAPLLGQDVSTPAPPKSVGLTIDTVYSDGQSMQGLTYVPDPTKEAVEQVFTVNVPYTENGVTKTRSETRSRMASPNVQKLVPLSESDLFMNLKGEQLDQATLARSVTGAGKLVLRFPRVPSKQELELISQLVRDEAVIFVPAPKPPR